MQKMHDHEVSIDILLVRKLLQQQFPQWANLPFSPVLSDGTDNMIYRLGTDMCIRLPRIPSAAKQIETEQKWLPYLSPSLPLAIPDILGKGNPDANFPFHWFICRWIDGENAATSHITDLRQTAVDLAEFLKALQKIDPIGGPPSRRGLPLFSQDKDVRAALESLHGMIPNTGLLSEIWKECLQASLWDKEPVWIHGDLLPANLIIQNGKLTAIIDFGLMGIGDPACDLIAAWSLLTADTRDIFRATLNVDDATWIRGRGWALSIALIILPYYWDTNPGLVTVAKRMIKEILVAV